MNREFGASRVNSGFTLVEIAVVVVIAGLLAAMFIGITASLLSQQRLQSTRAKLANVDVALTLFVSQYKRLPCPADGRLPSSDANAGTENSNVAFPQTEAGAGAVRTCTGNQQHGVVPWRVLGLAASDIEDGWGNRLTYRAGPDLIRDNAMDFTSCDPAGTGAVNATPPPFCMTAGPASGQCNAANLSNCTSPNAALVGAVGKGLVVRNVAGTILMEPRGTGSPLVSTGAAYAVVSHGAEGGGAYNSDGILQSTAAAAGTEEAKNFANVAYALPPASGTPTAYIVDDTPAAGAAHFDDLVSRPNILVLATKAGVGPRSR